jgi:hypothetical protein
MRSQTVACGFFGREQYLSVLVSQGKTFLVGNSPITVKDGRLTMAGFHVTVTLPDGTTRPFDQPDSVFAITFVGPDQIFLTGVYPTPTVLHRCDDPRLVKEALALLK